MGKVDVFQVAFRDAKTTFFPGEVINGTLNLKVNSELKLRGIRLEFHGAANVFLSSGDQRRKRPANSEVYIDLVATLFGKAPDETGENPVLQPGEYNFPFQFHTPAQNLPTSVEGNFGHVRYWLKASIDRPWRFDITTKSVFTVIEYVDINADEELLRPCQVDEQEGFGCSCIPKVIQVTVQTDRIGYCPGESIAVSAFIRNPTNYRINGVEIILFQNSLYTIKSGKHSRRVADKVSSVKRDETSGNGDLHMEMVPFPIPSLPPTMKSCSCIKITYELKFIVHVASGFSTKKIVSTIPITIGSVPYRYPALLPSLEPSAPPLSPPVYSEDAQPYPVLPSYAECVNGGTAVQEERDAGDMSPSTFTPMYPFVNDYQFPSAPSQHAAAAQALPVSSSKPRIPSDTLN